MNTISRAFIFRLRRRTLALQNTLKTAARKITGGTDYRRWGNENDLSPDWHSRTQQMAELVQPGSSVLEFGAGKRILEQLLPDGCTYTPSDLVYRGPGTIVCDLNATFLPVFVQHDVAVLGGVLEYVNDLPRLVSHLSRSVRVVIASYAVTNKNRRNRRARGWVNDYSTTEVVELFERNGFICEFTGMWRSQDIYRFTKK